MSAIKQPMGEAAFELDSYSRLKSAFPSAAPDAAAGSQPGAPGVNARQSLLEGLNAAIRQSIATGTPAALLLIDINNFSGINAAWGAAAGDEVLAATAQRVVRFAGERFGRTSSGSAVMAGQLDGDHFAIIVQEVLDFPALKVTASELVRELAQPLTLSGQPVVVGARSVMVQIPAHGRSVTSVLGRGFKLLNTVARSQPYAVVVSEPDGKLSELMAMLESDLATALLSDQLSIALQPKFEIEFGQVRGAEALARWRHPRRGWLPPSLFIETAEKSGIIFDLGLRVLREACVASNKLEAFAKGLSIAVNVSPHQLAHPDFLPSFLGVIDREGVAPQTLEIELTETAAMMGGERITQSLQTLRRCGIAVAIDDFGTGFSNLATLAMFPADTMKIDRSLVAFDEEDERAASLLGIAVQLAQAFNIKTVAEGVETEAQLERVRRLGCDYVQGFLTGKPVSADDFAEMYLRP